MPRMTRRLQRQIDETTHRKMRDSFIQSSQVGFSLAKGLDTNYGEGGGLQNGRGRHVKFYPYEKGGGGKKF